MTGKQRENQQKKREEQRLVVGRAAWWMPRPRSDMVAIREEELSTQKLPFAAAFKDLMQNLSFHCYGKLVEHGRRIQERFFWILFHITAFCLLVASIWGTYKDATEALVTTIYNPLYPVSKVDLPAISICSMNRISRQAVWHYAHELSGKDLLRRNASFFFRELRSFGMFYNHEELGDYEKVLRFQGFLDIADTKSHELFFNTRQRMRDLTPKCGDILVSCRFAGRFFDCPQQFRVSLTSYGFCCTLDPRGKYENLFGTYSHLQERPYHERFFGADMGLVLTLKSNPSDNFYKKFEQDGFAVAISEAGAYVDPQSGGVSIRFINAGRSYHLPIRPRIFETVPEARDMSPTVRQCLFEDEVRHNFSYRYTFSKCISSCRARSIFSLCECLPFYMPKRYIGGAPGLVFCTLQHMECLRRYKFKWLNVITSRAVVPGLEHELQDALYCPDCLASCSEIRYQVRGTMVLGLNGLYKSPTNNNNNNGNNNSIDGTTNNNSSSSHDSSELAVVRIYFAETHIQYFRQIIKNAWYEIFSTIGNICGIIAGFSLIGICELLFFLAKQLWHAYKAELKAELCHNRSRTRTLTRTRTRSQTQTRANGRAKATQQQQQQEQEQQPMELLILP